MNIAKHIIRNMTRQINHSATCHCRHNSPITELAKAATFATGVIVANEVIKNHYNPNGIKGAVDDIISEFLGTPKKAAESSSSGSKYIDGIIGKLAACYYIARIDNSISAEEQAELDMTISNILAIEKLPKNYVDDLNRIKNSTDNSFSSIEPYLNRVDSNVLISYLIDMQKIARCNGVSPSEENAINVYKNYVSRRSGYTFSDIQSEKIDLTCEGCGATMEIDKNYDKAICPYCGRVKGIKYNFS